MIVDPKKSMTERLADMDRKLDLKQAAALGAIERANTDVARYKAACPDDRKTKLGIAVPSRAEVSDDTEDQDSGEAKKSAVA